MQHATPVHHCLATVAMDYTKRPWVFRLQTADLGEFLFQATSAEDLQEWVETINLVAAALSAPALPPPAASSAKFQRPTLPISHTRLKPVSSACHGVLIFEGREGGGGHFARISEQCLLKCASSMESRAENDLGPPGEGGIASSGNSCLGTC